MPPVYADATDFAALGLPSAVATRAAAKGVTVDRHLSSASRWADSYLAARYALPLTAWDDALREAVCARAAWTVLTVVGFNPQDPADAAVRARFEDARRWLEGVRDRALNPDVTETPPETLAPVAVSDDPRGW